MVQGEGVRAFEKGVRDGTSDNNEGSRKRWVPSRVQCVGADLSRSFFIPSWSRVYHKSSLTILRLLHRADKQSTAKHYISVLVR